VTPWRRQSPQFSASDYEPRPSQSPKQSLYSYTWQVTITVFVLILHLAVYGNERIEHVISPCSSLYFFLFPLSSFGCSSLCCFLFLSSLVCVSAVYRYPKRGYSHCTLLCTNNYPIALQ